MDTGGKLIHANVDGSSTSQETSRWSFRRGMLSHCCGPLFLDFWCYDAPDVYGWSQTWTTLISCEAMSLWWMQHVSYHFLADILEGFPERECLNDSIFCSETSVNSSALILPFQMWKLATPTWPFTIRDGGFSTDHWCFWIRFTHGCFFALL